MKGPEVLGLFGDWATAFGALWDHARGQSVVVPIDGEIAWAGRRWDASRLSIRRLRHGRFALLRRSDGTVHAGSKALRRRAREFFG